MKLIRFAAMAIGAVIWLGACGGGDDTVAAASEETSTVDDTAVPATTTATVDHARLAASATWDIYRSQVDVDTAIACVLTRDIDPNFQRGMDGEKFDAIFDVYFASQGTPDDEEAAIAFENYEQLEVVADVDNWIFKEVFEHEMLALVTADPAATTPITDLFRDLYEQVIESELDEMVDIGPVMRGTVGQALYTRNLGCPLSVGLTDMTNAMDNFASDEVSFGGRGEFARDRALLPLWSTYRLQNSQTTPAATRPRTSSNWH